MMLQKAIFEMQTRHSLFPKLDSTSRIQWIDSARGFVLLNTTIFWLLPDSVRHQYAQIMLHPTSDSTFINYHDIGAVVYISIMGLMMPRSYIKRSITNTESRAFKHMLFRYAAMIATGILLGISSGQSFIATLDGQTLYSANFPLIDWGILQSLGVVGILAVILLRLHLHWSLRIFLASLFLAFYQSMLSYGGWRDHALASIHGGYLAAIFSFSFPMILGSVVGDSLFCNDTVSRKFKIILLTVVASGSGLIALGLVSFPALYPNKNEVTASYILIATSITFFGLLVFLLIDALWKKPIFLINAFGKNAILIFALLLLEDVAERLNLLVLTQTTSTLLITAMLFVVYQLERRKIVITL